MTRAAAKKAPVAAAFPRPAVPKIAVPRGLRQVSSTLVDAGASWGAKLLKGQVVRFIDLEGQQAVDFLCYNASDTRDRYNAANTMKMAENLYLNTGTVLYGEYATPLMKVLASNCPNHERCNYRKKRTSDSLLNRFPKNAIETKSSTLKNNSQACTNQQRKCRSCITV